MPFSLGRPREVGGHGEGSKQRIKEVSGKKSSNKLAGEDKTHHIYSAFNYIVLLHELFA